MESDGSAFNFLSVDALNIPAIGVDGAVEVRGFQGATLVGTDSFLFGDSVTTLSASVLSGLALTKLEIFGQFGAEIAVAFDNVRLETNPIPLPAAAWLLLGPPTPSHPDRRASLILFVVLHPPFVNMT